MPSWYSRHCPNVQSVCNITHSSLYTSDSMVYCNSHNKQMHKYQEFIKCYAKPDTYMETAK